MKLNLFENIVNGVTRKVKNSISNPYEKIGLNWWQVRFLKNMGAGTKTFKVFGSTLFITNKEELIHAIDEIFIEEVYKVSLPENALIIDCGANIGISVLYFKLQHPTAKVIAFEPDEINFNLLRQNIDSFKLENVEIHKKAVWNENTVITFSNEGTMSSKIESGSSMNESKVIQIPAIRLKGLLNQPVHFLKLDIEGAEYEVLKDSEDSLKNIENLFIEYHGHFNKMHELTEILSILEKQDFSFYIKEAAPTYITPFYRMESSKTYDLQLNIFAFNAAKI